MAIQTVTTLKQVLILISALLFFLMVNTSFFWEKQLGSTAFPFFLLLVVCYLIFFLVLIKQSKQLLQEGLTNRKRLYVSVLLATVLILVALFPTGVVDFDRLSGRDVLIASREGAANCGTTLKLKDNRRFAEKSVCFGISETNGTYQLRGDTIIFDDIKSGRNTDGYYEYAVIGPSKIFNDESLSSIVLYKGKADTIGDELWIIKNELIK
jgi:hypothetical protein